MQSHFTSHLKSIARMTLSTFVSRVGLRLLLLADAVMIGRYSAEQLAWSGAANAVGSVLLVLAPGLLIGCLISAAGAHARGETHNIGPIWRLAVLYGTAIGLLSALLCLAGPWLLRLLGQSERVSAEGGWLMLWIGLGLPFHFAGFATLYTLEAVGRANVGARVLIPAVGANVALNAVLVFEGGAGLGADGALLGTVLVRAGIFMALAAMLLRGTDRQAYGLDHWRLPELANCRGVIKLGLAGGVALLGESAAFASLTIFAGWIGERALAVHTILFNVLSAIFTTALAVGVATSIQVAAARATGDTKGAAQAAKASMLIAVALMGTFGTLAWLFAEHVASLFTADPVTAAAAASLIGWVTLFLLADGAQVSIHHAVRGMGDAWPATAINLFCYVVVMTALAWLFAIPGEQGVAGLFQGGLIASIMVVALQIWRFRVLVRRHA
ncbi:MAG: MATE family efflux transporter [Alphaproteobacteria bacterium]